MRGAPAAGAAAVRARPMQAARVMLLHACVSVCERVRVMSERVCV